MSQNQNFLKVSYNLNSLKGGYIQDNGKENGNYYLGVYALGSAP